VTGFYRPADGPETQPFGTRQLQDGLPHAGTDFGYTGTDGKPAPAVYAAENGTVLFAGDSRTLGWPNPWYTNPDFDRTDARDSSAGNMVVIGHRDGVTTYNHLAAFSVAKGQGVSRGQRIATIGATGNANGPHLHFEWIPYRSATNRTFNFNTATYGRARPIFTPRTEEDPFMAYTDKERAEILAAARLINARAKYLDAPVSAVPGKTVKGLMFEPVARAGGRTGKTNFYSTLAWLDRNLDAANDDAGTAGRPADPESGK
jgi:murein DD-endopeptidase MepM/ murein hydrolase activator NlpD